MQSGDRSEFELQLRALCAGFNVPVGDRMEAYWLALSKMSLLDFARCIDFSLGENGPEKIPTTSQMWGIKKKLRAVGTVAVPMVGADGKALPTIQEQLCAYGSLMLKGRDLPPRPWTYVYREWRDEKGSACAECTGVVIELDDGIKIGWTAAMMIGDPEGHADALRSFQPGQRPTSAQRNVLANLGGQP